MDNYFVNLLEKHDIAHEFRGEEIWYRCPLPGHSNDDVNMSASYHIYKNKCNCFVHGGGVHKLFMYLENKTYDEAIGEISSHKNEIEKTKFIFEKEKYRNNKQAVVISKSLLNKYKKQIHKSYTFENFTSKLSIIKMLEIGFDTKSKRVTIPVKDENSKDAFVIKRSIFPYAKKRYINEPENSKKSDYVYGLYLWKNPEYLIVVEGPKAVIRCIDKGIENVVAVMGSKPSKKQLKLLATKTYKLYSALDDDEAGRLGLEIFKKNSDYFVNGLYMFQHPKITRKEIINNKRLDIADYTLKEIKYGIDNAIMYKL